MRCRVVVARLAEVHRSHPANTVRANTAPAHTPGPGRLVFPVRPSLVRATATLTHTDRLCGCATVVQVLGDLHGTTPMARPRVRPARPAHAAQGHEAVRQPRVPLVALHLEALRRKKLEFLELLHGEFAPVGLLLLILPPLLPLLFGVTNPGSGRTPFLARPQRRFAAIDQRARPRAEEVVRAEGGLRELQVEEKPDDGGAAKPAPVVRNVLVGCTCAGILVFYYCYL